MKVANFNGCKVYNLSTGKTMPEWLSQSKKRALAKDEDYQKRLELIQDFEMTTAAQCITMSKDCEHIIVTGTYPPVVKCFTTNDLAMKFQRGLTAEVIAMQSLSDDFGKLIFLQNDRTINIHAPYGTHYTLRIPKFGRDLQYNWDNCDLYVSSSSQEIYRLNLETGQFREPFTLSYDGCNKMHINPVHQLLGCGGDGGFCEFWDPRQRKKVSILEIKDENSTNSTGIGSVSSKTAITSIKFDSDGLTLGVGTNHGNVYLYDIQHQYGLPIIDIHYHHSTKNIITTDKKIIKIWERDGSNLGKIVTNIETTSDINNILFVNDRRGETGLIMIAGEQSRITTYFVPQLGPAPRWCSFLENLTEELEELSSSQNTIYEDYKFITRNELDELGATSLLGTNMLKAYMHGFFIEMKLYNKLRAVSKPFEYDEYRKMKIKEKIESNRNSRITVLKKLPKINQEYAEKLIKQQLKQQKQQSFLDGKDEEERENDDEEPHNNKKKKQVVIDPKKLVDPRFAAIFEREEFQQNVEDEEFKLRNPVRSKISLEKQKRRKEEGEDEGDLYEEVDGVDDEDVDEDDDEAGANSDASDDEDLEFDDDDNDDGVRAAGSENDDDDDDDDDEGYDDQRESNKNKKRQRKLSNYRKKDNQQPQEEELGAIGKATLKSKLKKMEKQENKKMKMFTLNDSFNSDEILFSNKQHLKSLRNEEKIVANLPIQQRLQQQQQQRQSSPQQDNEGKYGKKKKRSFGKEQNAKIKVYKSKDQGTIREISFFPSK